MSFSAHADAKGLLQLIKNAAPKNLVLVHGDSMVMKNFQKSAEINIGCNTTMPGNLEEIFFNVYQIYTQLNIDYTFYNFLLYLIDKNKSSIKGETDLIKNFPTKLVSIDNGDCEIGNNNRNNTNNLNNLINLKINYTNKSFSRLKQKFNKNNFGSITNNLVINFKKSTNNMSIQDEFNKLLKHCFPKIDLDVILSELTIVQNDTNLVVTWKKVISKVCMDKEDYKKEMQILSVVKFLSNFISVLSKE